METKEVAGMHYILKLIVITLCLVIAPLATAQTVRYQHTDMLGTPIMEIDESGNVISRSVYEPFGKRLDGEEAGIGFTGHLQDEDLGLTYMQARYYDPVIGRFYSNDPASFSNIHNFNRYTYANNNPYKYIDPDGNSSVVATWGLRALGGVTFVLPVPGARPAAIALIAMSLTGDTSSGDTPPEIEGVVDLVDDLAGQELIGEIEAGEGKVLEGMGDDKFDPETGTHDKVVKNRTNADETKTELHTERNRKTQKVDKAKVKQDGQNSRENNQ